MARPELKSGSLGLDGNLNRKVSPWLSNEGFYQLDGFNLDEALSISKWRGFSKFNDTQLTETGTAATFTGIFDYQKSDQTSQKIGTTLTGLYKFDTNHWTAIDLANCGGARTGTATDLFDAAIYNDLLCLGNGVDANVKYDGTNAYNLGITGPTDPCSAALAGAGAGNLSDGVYQYKITFYNSSLGHESNPSDDNTVEQSVSVTVADHTTDGKVALTSIPVSTDAQVNKRKIYRTTADGAVFLYLATINDNSTTTYTDNIADTSLGEAVDQFGNGVPPTFAYIKFWKGNAFMAAKNSSTVYFSKSGYPNAVDSNDFRDLGKNDGSVITGMALLHDTLVVYKGTSIWVAYGEDRNTFGFNRQVSDIGSVSNQGIVSIPGKNVHVFPSTDGFHMFNGGVEAPIVGVGVQLDYQGLNQNRLSSICGRPHKTRKLLIWIASDSDSTQNDKIIWHDYLQDKWGTRDLSNTKANFIANLIDSANREQFYIGGYTGYVWLGDSGGSDDGSSITCTVIDRAHPKSTNAPEGINCFYHLFVWFKPVVGATISVSYALDDPDGTYVSLGTIDASQASGQNHIHFKALGRRIYPKFVESSTLQGVALRGWLLYYKNMGRHNAP